jgi:hypothetical protein
MTRTGLPFTIASGPRQRIHFGSESRGTRDHILLSQIRDFPLRHLLRLAGLRWRYSNPPPHRSDLARRGLSLYRRGTDHIENAVYSYCCRGMLPLSCLANSLGANYIENTSSSELLATCVLERVYRAVA